MSTGYGPIPNQRIKHQTRAKTSRGDYKVLPPGSIIKVIRQSYLSRGHPFEDADVRFQSIAYTQFGIALIDNTDIEWGVF